MESKPTEAGNTQNELGASGRARKQGSAQKQTDKNHINRSTPKGQRNQMKELSMG